MPPVRVHLIQAFTEAGVGGNGAGVVLDAQDLTPEQRQAVAAVVGLSETAFVSPSTRADFRLEFFTPARQLPHCGHATLATFWLLSRLGRITCDRSSKETVEDVRAIRFQADTVLMEQKAPVYRDPGIPAREVCAALGLESDALHPGAEPSVVSTGNAWLIVPVRDEHALAMARPVSARVLELSERCEAIGVYAVAPAPEGSGVDLAARMFAPRVGIDEESATGSAAGPAACFHHDRLGGGRTTIVLRQGHLMHPPSPSRIEARLNVDGGVVRNLLVGGRAAPAGERIVEVDATCAAR